MGLRRFKWQDEDRVQFEEALGFCRWRLLLSKKMASGISSGSLARIFVQPQYEDAWSYRDGYAAVKKDGKWGYINSQAGKLVIEPKV